MIATPYHGRVDPPSSDPSIHRRVREVGASLDLVLACGPACKCRWEKDMHRQFRCLTHVQASNPNQLLNNPSCLIQRSNHNQPLLCRCGQ